VTHAVTVAAASLYEAAACGIAEFRHSGFVFGGGWPGNAANDCDPPTTTHELPVAKLQSWLDTNGKTPREQAVKVTLRKGCV
jgi:hypothetical protein